MSRTPSKRNTKSESKRKASQSKSEGKRKRLECVQCHSPLPKGQKALFVEDEVGRVFCTEECIGKYFAAEVEELEREYLAYRPTKDLMIEDKETLQQLKWSTLNEPAEVWREKTIRGHHRYTLISDLDAEGTPAWYLCICLFLKNEPSFLFIGFATQDESLVQRFRRSEPVEWVNPSAESGENAAPPSDAHSDRLADDWTKEETFRAELLSHRRDDDIPMEKFGDYEHCVEETLEKPSEVWMYSEDEEETEEKPKVYHFIRNYPETKKPYSFVIVAKEIPDTEQLEILEAFPTWDPGMVEICRRGSKHEEEEEGIPTVSSLPAKILH